MSLVAAGWNLSDRYSFILVLRFYMFFSLLDDMRQRFYFEFDNFIDKTFPIEILLYLYSLYNIFKFEDAYTNEWSKHNLNNTTICLLRPF